MKLLFVCLALLFVSHHTSFGQYVPKEKRKTPTETSPADTTKPKAMDKKTKQETDDEPKFVAYIMAFPNLLQVNNRITINGGSASLNVGYRFHEKFNAGVATTYSYENYNNVTVGNSGTLNASIRSTGVGVFGQFHFNQNYFAWAEYNSLYFKANDRNPNTPQPIIRRWYSQPLFGIGAKYEFGSGNQGIASMMLFNPKYGDPLTPYRSLFVTRILYYFYF